MDQQSSVPVTPDVRSSRIARGADTPIVPAASEREVRGILSVCDAQEGADSTTAVFVAENLERVQLFLLQESTQALDAETVARVHNMIVKLVWGPEAPYFSKVDALDWAAALLRALGKVEERTGQQTQQLQSSQHTQNVLLDSNDQLVPAVAVLDSPLSDWNPNEVIKIATLGVPSLPSSCTVPDVTEWITKLTMYLKDVNHEDYGESTCILSNLGLMATHFAYSLLYVLNGSAHCDDRYKALADLLNEIASLMEAMQAMDDLSQELETLKEAKKRVFASIRAIVNNRVMQAGGADLIQEVEMHCASTVQMTNAMQMALLESAPDAPQDTLDDIQEEATALQREMAEQNRGIDGMRKTAREILR